MGLKLFSCSDSRSDTSAGMSCSATKYKPSFDTAPNPNKFVFTIEGIEKNGEYQLLSVHYPHCTTHRGRKLMLFKTYADIESWGELDPHFLENDISPIARFPATPEGLEMGRLMLMTLGK